MAVMLLESNDFLDFQRLHSQLMFHVGRENAMISRAVKDAKAFASLRPKQRAEIHAAFADKINFWIDAYLEKDPYGLSPDDRTAVLSWKRAVPGEFIILKQLVRHAVFLDAREEPKAYGVVGLTTPFEDMVGQFPALVETTLFPFRGQITHDAMMAVQAVSFGGNMKRGFNESFQDAKKKGRFFTSLESRAEEGAKPTAKKGKAPGKPKESQDAASRLARTVSTVNKQLGELRRRKAEIIQFEEEVIPAFENWLRENFGEKQQRLKDLETEIRDLEGALAKMRFGLAVGGFASGQEAVAAVLATLGENKRAGGSLDDQEDDDDYWDEEEDESEEDHENAGKGGAARSPREAIPPAVLKEMFSDLMRQIRHVDADRLAPEEYDAAYEEFLAALDGIEDGNFHSFERAVLQVGADDSEENLSAVNKIYRRLARQIHPDRNPEFSEEARDLWDELKAAKQSLSLPVLEKIETHWRVLRKDVFGEEEEARLKQFQKSVNIELKELRRAARMAEGHPMWGKTAGEAPPDGLKEQIAADLDDDISEFVGFKEEILADIEALRQFKWQPNRAKAAAPREPKPKRRSMMKTPTKGAANSKKQKPAGEDLAPTFEQMHFDF